MAAAHLRARSTLLLANTTRRALAALVNYSDEGSLFLAHAGLDVQRLRQPHRRVAIKIPAAYVESFRFFASDGQEPDPSDRTTRAIVRQLDSRRRGGAKVRASARVLKWITEVGLAQRGADLRSLPDCTGPDSAALLERVSGELQWLLTVHARLAAAS